LLVEVLNTLPTIVALSETWLKSSIIDSVINIDNYLLFRNDRLSLRGGGVCLYVNKSVISKKFTITELNISVKPYDSVWIKFENDQFNFVIACVYRPPTNSVLNSQNNDIILLDTIASTLEKFPNLIIVGDFNFPNINWSSKTSATTSNTKQIFVDFLSENSFSQLVNEPTRYRTCQNSSLLDLILTMDENLVTSVKVSSPIGISDHSTIKFDLQLLLYPDKKYKEYNYIKTDFENLNNELSLVDWNILKSLSTQEQWDKLLSIIRTYVHSNSRLFSRRLNCNKPWIDDSLLNKVKYKKKLWKKYKQTLSNSHLLEHRRFSNQLKAEIGRAKSKYEHLLIDKPKAFYSYVRKRIAGRVSVPLVRGVGGLLYSNFIETADTLAGSFALSYSIPALISTVPVVTTWNGSKLSHVDFDPGIVEEYLLQLSVDTAPGPDQTMSAKLLKNCAISLSTPLSEIMTSSFAAGVLPKKWLLATVTPLYKSGAAR
jgi:hypothetical protein